MSILQKFWQEMFWCDRSHLRYARVEWCKFPCTTIRQWRDWYPDLHKDMRFDMNLGSLTTLAEIIVLTVDTLVTQSSDGYRPAAIAGNSAYHDRGLMQK